MASIEVTTRIQHLTLVPDSDKITVGPGTSVVVVSDGPPGKPGPPGPDLRPAGGSDGQVLAKQGSDMVWASVGTTAEVDAKVAAHNQSTDVHENARSGRDYVALFENGII